MKKLTLFILAITSLICMGDVKLSQLPVGAAAATNGPDSFPYVDSVDMITKRILLSDIQNIPSLQSAFLSLAPTSANYVMAGPLSGSPSVPSFRLLSGADLNVALTQIGVSPLINNNLPLQWKDSGGTARSILNFDNTNLVTLQNPLAGSNAQLSLTNASGNGYAQLNGSSQITLTSNEVLFQGSTAPTSLVFPGSFGTVTLGAPNSSITTWAAYWPVSNGTSGQVLTTDGATPANWYWSNSSTTPPAGVTGDVQFNNAGAFGADDSNFFWDETDKRLGIGTNGPLTNIHSASSGASTTDHGITQENNSANAIGGGFILKKSRGTFSSPGAILANDALGRVLFYGYGTGYNATTPDAAMFAAAAQNFSGTAHGTNLTFSITPNNSIVRQSILGLNNDGGMVRYSPTATTQLSEYYTAGGTSYSINWPASQGTGALTNDGAGNLSWMSSAAAGATGAVQFNNAGTFAGDTSNFFWDDSGFRLGIGTNAVTSPITIQTNSFPKVISAGNSSAAAYLEFDSTNGVQYVAGADGPNNQGWAGTQSNHPFIFRTNNTGRITVSSGGNIQFNNYGEGVAQFDSSGNITSTAPGTSGNVLTSNGTTWISQTPTTGITALTGDVTASGSGSVAASVVKIQGTPVSATAPTTSQVLAYNGTAWAPATASSGTPGGTTGAIQYNNGGAFAGDASNLFWDDAGVRLGIGTNSITSPVTIVTASYPKVISATNTTAATYLEFDSTNGVQFVAMADGPNNQGLMGTQSNHQFVFRTNNTGRITVAAGGNIQFNNYGEGVAQFDSSGNITSTAPGTSGNVLTSSGGVWVSAPASGGSGTVTQVNTGTGITGGPITTTGTISLAAINNNDLLANTSGSSAAPVDTSLTALIDSAMGNSQGDILYRGASTWTVLSPGTSGFLLQTQGTGANPIWANGSSTYATTSLNNVAATSIGANLNPATTNTYQIGSSSSQWLAVSAFRYTTTNSPDSLLMGVLTSVIPGVTGVGIAQNGLQGFPTLTQDPLYVTTVSDSTSNTVATADIDIVTGNKTVGTANSGSINITAGTATGTQGSIRLLKSGVPSVSGQVWTASGTDGTGYWQTPSSGTVALNSITAATATNTINNLNFAQEWDWNTITTANAMKFASSTITSGSLLNLSASSASNVGPILEVTNTSTTSNSTDINVDASGSSGTGVNVSAVTSGNSTVGFHSQNSATGGATGLQIDNTGATGAGKGIVVNLSSNNANAVGLNITYSGATSPADGIQVNQNAGYGLDIKNHTANAVAQSIFLTNNDTSAAVGNGAEMVFGTSNGSPNKLIAGVAGVDEDNTATYGGAVVLYTTNGGGPTPIEHLRLDRWGHLISKGTLPTISACGTSPSIAGTDVNGRATVGTGGTATSCTVTFANAYTNAPTCSGGDEDSTTPLLTVLSATTTALTFTASTPFAAGDKLVYHCLGY
jgi:hypothetical protein